ncbi:MAG: flavin reductase (DIM6/NTAB) family NADH-FMN oxidoreductase RutF [Alphaproteobacteria bacterium]|jgi:flavin reductase (DIM6/NTAB) family NADH-FMN oxidoreductase RutF
MESPSCLTHHRRPPLNSTPDHGAVAGPESIPIDPAILYWGTPVVLVSTVNEDGAPNLAPM